MDFSQPERLLIAPYCGKLVDLRVKKEEREELRAHAHTLRQVQLTARSVCDLELLAAGAFSPLETFMCEQDYHHVVQEMRLANGVLFPIPITLTVKKDENLKLDSEVALSDPHNNLLSVMRIKEIFEWDRECEASLAYGTNDMRHPI